MPCEVLLFSVNHKRNGSGEKEEGVKKVHAEVNARMIPPLSLQMGSGAGAGLRRYCSALTTALFF